MEDTVLGRLNRKPMLCAVLVAVITAIIYGQYGSDGSLLRDDSLYLYSAQQLLDGTPPYVSIFDHKGPMGVFFDAAGLALGRALGIDEIEAVRRLAWLFCSAGTGLLFLLARRLLGSTGAALFAAAAFASFWGFGVTAISGPRPKTWSTILQIAAIYFTVEKRWFSAGLVGSLACLTWQPLAILPAASTLLAILHPGPVTRRSAILRLFAGGAIPLLATTLFFASHRAIGPWIEGMVVFNLEHLGRAERSIAAHFARIMRTMHEGFLWATYPILIGLAAAVAESARAVLTAGRGWDRLDSPWTPILLTVLPPIAWTMRDYQYFPDIFVFLPFVALGLGKLCLLAWQGAGERVPGARWAAMLLLVGVWTVSALAYRSEDVATFNRRHGELPKQRELARQIKERAEGHGSIVVVGAPEFNVLSKTHNPNRYGFMRRDIARYIDLHEPGGHAGWVAAIEEENPAVIVRENLTMVLFGGHLRELLQKKYGRPEKIATWRVYYRRDVP